MHMVCHEHIRMNLAGKERRKFMQQPKVELAVASLTESRHVVHAPLHDMEEAIGGTETSAPGHTLTTACPQEG